MSNPQAESAINQNPSAKKLGKRELDRVAGGGGGVRRDGPPQVCECVPGTSAVNTAVYNT